MLTKMEREMFELWNFMIECEIATEKEIGLAIALCGRTLETLERVLYIRTGCCSLEELIEEEEEED